MTNRETVEAVVDEDFVALGTQENDSRPATAAEETEMFKALGLKSISIRLQESLIDAYKALANIHGVGYQPLMRDVLERFIVAEMKKMAVEQSERLSAAREESSRIESLPPLPKAA